MKTFTLTNEGEDIPCAIDKKTARRIQFHTEQDGKRKLWWGRGRLFVFNIAVSGRSGNVLSTRNGEIADEQ